jgi:hypothetical protein
MYKITLADGTVRCRPVVDIGQDEAGRPMQLTRTLDRHPRNAQDKKVRLWDPPSPAPPRPSESPAGSSLFPAGNGAPDPGVDRRL